MGYLPVYQVQDFPDRKAPDGGGSDRVFIEAARKCKGDRWFPERIRFIRWYGTKYQVYLLEVSELDVDHRPADKEFTLHAPVGTAVGGDRDQKKHFRLKQDEAIGLGDIDRVFELWEKADGVAPMDSGLTAPRRRHRWWWIAGGLVGVGIIGLYRRARRRLT
jgi:hypothetical protein